MVPTLPYLWLFASAQPVAAKFGINWILFRWTSRSITAFDLPKFLMKIWCKVVVHFSLFHKALWLIVFSKNLLDLKLRRRMMKQKKIYLIDKFCNHLMFCITTVQCDICFLGYNISFDFLASHLTLTYIMMQFFFHVSKSKSHFVITVLF